MKDPSALLKMMFETARWQNLIEIADEKELDKKLIKQLCYPEERAKLYQLIIEDKYTVFPPTVAKIPKDTPGEFREVYVNSDLDRIVLTLINDCLCEMFHDMIHKNCVSYQKGIGTQEIVQRISKEIVKLDKIISTNQIGYKSDFSKYFDTVSIEAIDNVFNTVEDKLGFERNTEPVMNLLRRYYHQDYYFDSKNNLHEKYQSLKQGAAPAAFLANVILYELDDFMSKKYKIYYRYSDDVCVIDKNTDDVIKDMNLIIEKYGVKLNPKKVEPLYSDRWFKFLGFNIRGSLITLSKNRVKKFQKEIEKRSIKQKKKNKKYTGKQAKRAILRYLYEGEYSWSSSCLGTINVESDLQELNKYILDAIRACDTGKLKIGGLGSTNDLKDKTILRGRGRNVKSNREKTEEVMDNYLSVKCLSNDLKMSKAIFDVAVKEMKT